LIIIIYQYSFIHSHKRRRERERERERERYNQCVELLSFAVRSFSWSWWWRYEFFLFFFLLLLCVTVARFCEWLMINKKWERTLFPWLNMREKKRKRLFTCKERKEEILLLVEHFSHQPMNKNECLSSLTE
jgi:hypothetical protein